MRTNRGCHSGEGWCLRSLVTQGTQRTAWNQYLLNLQREPGPASTVILDFWPPKPENKCLVKSPLPQCSLLLQLWDTNSPSSSNRQAQDPGDPTTVSLCWLNPLPLPFWPDSRNTAQMADHPSFMGRGGAAVAGADKANSCPCGTLSPQVVKLTVSRRPGISTRSLKKIPEHRGRSWFRQDSQSTFPFHVSFLAYGDKWTIFSKYLRADGVVQWYKTCLACVRLWVQYPALPWKLYGM